MGIFIKPSAGEMVTAGLWALQEKDRWSLQRLRNTNYTCSLWKVSLINFAYLDKGGGRIGVYAEIWMRDNSVYSGAESFVRQSICSQQKQISLDYTNKGTHLQRHRARRRGAGVQAKLASGVLCTESWCKTTAVCFALQSVFIPLYFDVTLCTNNDWRT